MDIRIADHALAAYIGRSCLKLGFDQRDGPAGGRTYGEAGWQQRAKTYEACVANERSDALSKIVLRKISSVKTLMDHDARVGS